MPLLMRVVTYNSLNQAQRKLIADAAEAIEGAYNPYSGFLSVRRLSLLDAAPRELKNPGGLVGFGTARFLA